MIFCPNPNAFLHLNSNRHCFQLVVLNFFPVVYVTWFNMEAVMLSLRIYRLTGIGASVQGSFNMSNREPHSNQMCPFQHVLHEIQILYNCTDICWSLTIDQSIIGFLFIVVYRILCTIHVSKRGQSTHLRTVHQLLFRQGHQIASGLKVSTLHWPSL